MVKSIVCQIVSKKDFTFYSLKEFFEDSYYLSFHKEIMKICVYDIKTIEDYNKIFDLLKGFIYKFDRTNTIHAGFLNPSKNSKINKKSLGYSLSKIRRSSERG